MRTCVVHFGATLVSSAKLHEPEPAKYPNAYANVGTAGALIVMQEDVWWPEGHPEDKHHTAQTVAIYAPGTWLSVTYEDHATGA